LINKIIKKIRKTFFISSVFVAASFCAIILGCKYALNNSKFLSCGSWFVSIFKLLLDSFEFNSNVDDCCEFLPLGCLIVSSSNFFLDSNEFNDF
jgi:hypothetical protein